MKNLIIICSLLCICNLSFAQLSNSNEDYISCVSKCKNLGLTGEALTACINGCTIINSPSVRGLPTYDHNRSIDNTPDLTPFLEGNLKEGKQIVAEDKSSGLELGVEVKDGMKSYFALTENGKIIYPKYTKTISEKKTTCRVCYIVRIKNKFFIKCYYVPCEVNTNTITGKNRLIAQ